ncbi:MAG: FecR family protein [Candidatus Doudnabacteria bacterium]|nr:FecR family protein [Candidatus Doudnabacteria bacterium]
MNNSNKPKVIIGVVIIIILIVGVIAFVNSKKMPASQDVKAALITATTLEKTLVITKAGQTADSEIATKGEASEGDTLKTLATGRALVENSNGTRTVLDYNSKLTIAKQDPDGTHSSNFLHAGTAWAQVQKVLGTGEFYEIETQNAVAVVRGTKLQVSYNNSDSKVLVGEGQVSFIPIDQTTRARQTDKAVMVNPGMKGVIGADGKAVVTPMTEQEKQDPFFKYSENIAATQMQEPGAGKGSLRDIMAAGSDVTCSYTVNEGGAVSTGTFYISGTNFRGDFSIQSGAAGTVDSHMIRNGNDTYTWSGNQGAKITVDQSTQNNTAPLPDQGFDFNQQYNYNCSPWRKDASKFSVPAGVNFIDVGSFIPPKVR